MESTGDTLFFAGHDSGYTLAPIKTSLFFGKFKVIVLRIGFVDMNLGVYEHFWAPP